jgi:hypothetical protein
VCHSTDQLGTCVQVPPKPALRQPRKSQLPSVPSGANYAHYPTPYASTASEHMSHMNNYAKSNSLPRRRLHGGGQRVKFRDDAGGANESDGAISAPEYSMSLRDNNNSGEHTYTQDGHTPYVYVCVCVSGVLWINTQACLFHSAMTFCVPPLYGRSRAQRPCNGRQITTT